MASNRPSLNFQHAAELRELLQMANVRLVELEYLQGRAEYERVSEAIAAAVNSEPSGWIVGMDLNARVVRVDLVALANRIGGAFTAAGVRPEFLKPVFRPEGLGWFRHTGWRVARNSGVARSFAYEERLGAAGEVSA